MEYIKNERSSQSPKGIANHEIFFKNLSYKQQASSNRQQAGGWAHRRQAVDIMGFSGMISYDSAGPTMSQKNCLLHTRRARPWSFRRWTHFTRTHQSLAPAQRLISLAEFTKFKEIRTRKTESCFLQNRKATSNRLQASSAKRQATSFPSFGYRRVGGPIGYKLFNRGPWIKFYGSWNEGLD